MSKLDVVVSYWAAEGVGNVSGDLAHFSDDAVFESPTMRLEGKSSIRTYYDGMAGAFAQVLVTPVHTIEQGDEIAVEWTCTLVGKDGTEKKTRGCNVFVVAGGLIRQLRAYFDPVAFQ